MEDLSNEAVRGVMREQICIEIPNYGTRTHTIIIVDDKDHVSYYEADLKFPMNGSNSEWENNVFEFNLE